MESRIPLPSDNIFKFYAFFGLLLIVFGMGSSLYVSQSTNNLIFDIAVEYQLLSVNPGRSVAEETRFQLLDQKLEVAKENKQIFNISIGMILAVGILLAFYGFRKWHKEIQPLQDEMVRLNLEKLRREVG